LRTIPLMDTPKKCKLCVQSSLRTKAHNGSLRCIAADKRIEEYRNFYDEAIQPEEESSAPRVKVAVLDTGLDHSTHSIQAYSERIVEVKSWLPPRNGLASNGTDKSGHGTHVTGLLLTMAPDCDIYVAQIADENGLIPPKDIAKVLPTIGVLCLPIMNTNTSRSIGHRTRSDNLGGGHNIYVLRVYRREI